MLRRLPWPLPALLTWGAAWACWLLLARALPWWWALLAACAVGLLASLAMPTWWRRAIVAGGFPLVWLGLAAGSLPAWGWLLPMGLLLLVYPLNAWRDAPVFPTPAGALDGLVPHLPLRAGAHVLDAGCGMGDGLRALHQAWPQAQVYGVEWSWPLCAASWLRCPWARVRRANFWEIDWSPFDVVYLFQRPESMPRAGVKALGELRDGAWLISLDFPLPHATAQITIELEGRHTVYAYQAPWELIDHDAVLADDVAHMLPARPAGVTVNGQALYPRRRRPGGRLHRPAQH